VLAAWKGLPGLLIGRLITGVSVGLAAGTAITYLIELRLRADPKASPVRARTIGASVTIGALGIGPLIAGYLAQWVTQPLTVPYLVFLALGAVALAEPFTARIREDQQAQDCAPGTRAQQAGYGSSRSRRSCSA
jgi:MFS family permease